MFTIHQHLSPELIATVVSHLEESVAPHLTTDVSNYAQGRKRIWLPYEAPLAATRPWEMGLQDERLWSWVTRICEHHNFTPEIGLISRGGAIKRHRDATYADWVSFGINLGEAVFGYEHCYPEFKWTPDTPTSAPVERYKLTGGEVFSFNPKNPHWVEDVAEDRWGINLWRISNKERKRFDQFRQG